MRGEERVFEDKAIEVMSILMLEGSEMRTLLTVLTLLRHNLTRAGQASYLNTFHLKFSISIHFKGKLQTKFHYFCFFCDQKPFMLSQLKEERPQRKAEKEVVGVTLD